jgi:hypothetical protein
MSQRPDDDATGCTLWTEGRPGDGVIVMDMWGWTPPPSFRVEGDRPARYGRRASGLHRFTAAEDVPLLRAMDATSACSGDGHYECRRCIFFRSAGDA